MGNKQRVVMKPSNDYSATIYSDDRWQVKAVHVGKGIEIQRNPDLNGWVDASVMAKWCKRVRKMAKAIEREQGRSSWA